MNPIGAFLPSQEYLQLTLGRNTERQTNFYADQQYGVSDAFFWML